MESLEESSRPGPEEDQSRGPQDAIEAPTAGGARRNAYQSPSPQGDQGDGDPQGRGTPPRPSDARG